MKSHGRNQSSANFSRMCLKSKPNTSSSHNSPEKISKYFTSPTKSEEKASTGVNKLNTSDDKCNEHVAGKSLPRTSIQSPYKNFVTEISSGNINTSINEENDFKTPKHVFKKKLQKPKVIPSNNVRKKGRKPKISKDSKPYEQMVLTKTVKKAWNETDVNVEHLQLAIALSRSLQSNYKHESAENNQAASSTSTMYPSTQQKIANIKETLEQFGLKSISNKVDVKHKRISVKGKKKKYITPVLMLRTQKDRERLVSEKISLILSEHSQDDVKYSSKKSHIAPISDILKKNWSDDNRIFKLNSIELNTLKNSDTFYVKSLNVLPSGTKCGSLLKDWSHIPGRDKSPLHKNTNEVVVIDSEDENQTSSVSNQYTANENTIMCCTINSGLTCTVPANISTTLKNNLQIRSFTNRSISPELFGSDEEIDKEIPEKNSLQQIFTGLDDDDDDSNSESLLNLTPKKNKVATACSAVGLSSNQNLDRGKDLINESLLSTTPTRKNKSLNVSVLENDTTSPLLPNKSKISSSQASKNKTYANTLELSNDDLFVNDNGICTYECFSNDGLIDLINSSDEENNGLNEEKDACVFYSSQPSHEESGLKDISFEITPTNNINNTLQNISPIIASNIKPSLSTGIPNVMYLQEENENNSNVKEIQISPVPSSKIHISSTGISEIMQKSMYLHEQNENDCAVQKIPETTRQSTSLNITEYICNMLNEDHVSSIKNSEQCELESEVIPNAGTSNVFDLTQSSSCSNHSICTPHQENCTPAKRRSKEILSGSDTDDILSPAKTNRFDKQDSFKSTTSDDINLSQGSQESICISDEELNYSSVYGTPSIKRKRNSTYKHNYVYEISDENNMKDDNLNKMMTRPYDDVNLNFTPKTSKEFLNNKPDLTDIQSSDNCKMVVDLLATTSSSVNCNQGILQHPRINSLSREHTPTALKSRKSLFNGDNVLNDSFNTALESSYLFDKAQQPQVGSSGASKQVHLETQGSTAIETNTTPKGSMLIKTTNVTPIANYNEMDTPKISKELQKFGLKPLKRQRGIQILKHIYESTHPVVSQTIPDCENLESDEGDQKVIKKRKKMKGTRKSQSPKKPRSPKKSCDEGKNDQTACEMMDVNMQFRNLEEKIEIVGDLMGKNEPVDNIIFERKHSTKVSSCRVPLHIAWHNLVSSQPELRKNILLYEPLQLEVLYQLLKEQGYKYHIQDLLTFLDRKCITIRTNQNDRRNSRQHRKSVSPQKRNLKI